MSKKKAIFIPAAIRSHVLPTFYLADLLSEEYEIVYAVGSETLGDLCEKNGFKYFTVGGLRVNLGLEERYIKEKYGKVGFIRLLKAYLTNELFWKRKNLYDRIVKDWQPDLVIIDVFMSNDFFVLKQYSALKIAFFNPMPSIYNLNASPGYTDLTISDSSATNEAKSDTPKLNLWHLLKGGKHYLLRLARDMQYFNLLKNTGLTGNNKPVKSKFTLLFKNVPELLLLPEEFEFRLNRKKDYQFYLGLCQRGERVDTEIDESFSTKWPDILKRKNKGEKIIYCSFGTFFEAADRKLLNFIKVLITALRDFEKIHLVCSVNKFVIEAFKVEEHDKDRVSLFYKVPQALVLQNAAAFITHGGMSSIKESIFHKVPMLVFPLDPVYDQSSNALRVEFHKLGLRGTLDYERVDSMKAKLKDVLNDNIYRKSLCKFNDDIAERYSIENLQILIKENICIA